jgi:stress-induced morphogen
MAVAIKNVDRDVQRILERLREDYLPAHPKARVEAYRYKNLLSIRVRILDPDFTGKALSEREESVWHVLHTLPERTRGDISMILLLTPKEAEASLLNQEFEDPSPSML